MPDFYSGCAIGISGRLTEGLLLWRSHPPVGMNIFIIQAQVPDVPVLKIYQGIVPFLAAPFVLLVLLVAFPQIALWLPGYLFK